MPVSGSVVTISRTLKAPAGTPVAASPALVRLSALAAQEASAGVPKLQGLWKADPNTYAAGVWQPTIGGLNFSPWTATAPTLTAEAGPDGTYAIVTSTGGNPGVLVAPAGAMDWDREHDFSLVAVIDPGAAGAASKAIVAGYDYDNTPVFQARTDGGMSADFDVDSAGGGLVLFGSQIPAGRFWVVTLTWNASATTWRVRRGNAAALDTETGTPNTPSVTRLTLFGGPEQPPELTPGTTRYRVPAYNMKMAAFAKLNVDIFEDVAAWNLLWPWLLETYPSACAAPA